MYRAGVSSLKQVDTNFGAFKANLKVQLETLLGLSRCYRSCDSDTSVLNSSGTKEWLMNQ
ncbi:unnamed protein product [Paramecium octaurelia]|uniref:Uncharacterized protein n=1 Tax=Paramecium octaurelia TaxID=43137 RepID=A0A8S1SNE5_PAROT|nr:unnamed protein product [Paramecium octaurelia]